MKNRPPLEGNVFLLMSPRSMKRMSEHSSNLIERLHFVITSSYTAKSLLLLLLCLLLLMEQIKNTSKPGEILPGDESG